MGIKLKSAHETDVFINCNGYASIAQGEEQDRQAVHLTPEQLPHVIDELQTLLDRKDEWWDIQIAEDEPPAKASS